MALTDELRRIAEETNFSGVAVVSHGTKRHIELAQGLAHRALDRGITTRTQFGTASATKGFTALTTASLIESGEITWNTRVRDLLGDAVPLVDGHVTIEHLLGHTSGVGDYLDEEALGDVDEHVLDVAAHRLERPHDYLPLMAHLPQRSEPGAEFRYNNSGYVLLSAAIEAATGDSFHDLVTKRVLAPASMNDTGFLRSDELPGRAALGYLANGRTNVFHLPVRGAGDGGIYTTVDDIDALWQALFAGTIVSLGTVTELTSPRHDVPTEGLRYGLGFWLRADRPTVMLEGMDAGVSFRAAHDEASGIGYTVIANTSAGAWPLVAHLDQHLFEPTA